MGLSTPSIATLCARQPSPIAECYRGVVGRRQVGLRAASRARPGRLTFVPQTRCSGRGRTEGGRVALVHASVKRGKWLARARPAVLKPRKPHYKEQQSPWGLAAESLYIRP